MWSGGRMVHEIISRKMLIVRALFTMHCPTLHFRKKNAAPCRTPIAIGLLLLASLEFLTAGVAATESTTALVP
jgi:hypothetical protein